MKIQTPILPALAATMLATILATSCMNAPIPAQPVQVPVSPLPAATLAAPPVPSAVAGGEVRVSLAAPSAERIRALLVVQNHGGSTETGLSLQQLGDWLTVAFGAGAIAVVNPHDAIGTTQNVGIWGEKMPEASAVELAGKLDTALLLTASITDVRMDRISGTDPGVQAVLDLTLSAKETSRGGATLASVNVTERGKKRSGEIAFRENAANDWSGVAKEAAFTAAPALEKALAGLKPAAGAGDVRAFFAANVPGANVRIDGVSYGTVETNTLAIAVPPGLHNLEIAYPGLVPFKDLAMIREGSSFVTILGMTDASAAAARQDAYFAALLDRIEKSGLTDDLVRETVAKGYAQYLSASHAKIEGMPQTLGGNAPSLGLDAVSPAKPVQTPTTAELLQKAASMLQ